MTQPIKERIALAFEGEPRLTYHDLLSRVFPEKDYPRAYRGAVHGGPPGCAMAFGRALRDMGLRETGEMRWIYPNTAVRGLASTVMNRHGLAKVMQRATAAALEKTKLRRKR